MIPAENPISLFGIYPCLNEKLNQFHLPNSDKDWEQVILNHGFFHCAKYFELLDPKMQIDQREDAIKKLILDIDNSNSLSSYSPEVIQLMCYVLRSCGITEGVPDFNFGSKTWSDFYQFCQRDNEQPLTTIPKLVRGQAIELRQDIERCGRAKRGKIDFSALPYLMLAPTEGYGYFRCPQNPDLLIVGMDQVKAAVGDLRFAIGADLTSEDTDRLTVFAVSDLCISSLLSILPYDLYPDRSLAEAHVSLQMYTALSLKGILWAE